MNDNKQIENGHDPMTVPFHESGIFDTHEIRSKNTETVFLEETSFSREKVAASFIPCCCCCCCSNSKTTYWLRVKWSRVIVVVVVVDQHCLP